MESIDWLLQGGRYLTATVTLLSALLASAHAVIWKRDLRSALLWIVVIWLVPLAGPMLYLLLGTNRIERRAKALRREAGRALVAPRVSPRVPEPAGQCAVPDGLRPLANLVSQLVARALLPGNRIEPLVNGEQAYPSMLEAIMNTGASTAALPSTSFLHSGNRQHLRMDAEGY